MCVSSAANRFGANVLCLINFGSRFDLIHILVSKFATRFDPAKKACFSARAHVVLFLETKIFLASHSYQAATAQLGERQTEDLKVPGSIPGLGMTNVSTKAYS